LFAGEGFTGLEEAAWGEGGLGGGSAHRCCLGLG
jgi:hypothetical protein